MVKTNYFPSKKAVNVIDYDFSISEKGIKTLEKANVKIKKGKMENIIFRKVDYTLKINLFSKYKNFIITVK
ncbi:hypothetical protein AEQU2_02965 [Aequorivita lipolytica]|nr:hypothetical protein AEQU2_02965 [Aequorivita lipolytica]